MKSTHQGTPPVMRDLGSLRDQEIALVALNAAVLGSLLVIRGGFVADIGPADRSLLVALTLRCAALGLELAWLRRRPSDGALERYSHASIWVNVLFALLASLLDTEEDSHYWGLLVIPVVSAAFRYGLGRTLVVAAAAGAVAFAHVWSFYRRFPPVDFGEYREAAAVSVIFALVGVIVWVLADHLRRDRERLRENLDELRRTRDHLVAEEKLAAVGRLSGAIAHEIRNPVAMISSSLAMALEGAREEPLRLELFEIAAREAGRLERLTTDFLSYAHTRPPERGTTQLRTLLENVASLARAHASSGDVTIAVACVGDPEASVDQFQIQQALLNLTINAIAATPAGGAVTLSAARAREGGLSLSVENTGDPVPPEAAARIFEPFYTTRPGGTGLGLAITRNIARAHGGDVALERNEPGLVRFTITLPEPAREPAPPGEGGADGARSRR